MRVTNAPIRLRGTVLWVAWNYRAPMQVPSPAAAPLCTIGNKFGGAV